MSTYDVPIQSTSLATLPLWRHQETSMKLPVLALTTAATAFGLNTALPFALDAVNAVGHFLVRVSDLTTYFT